ncbi:MAG: two-component regulator propeller domain-containing protein [Ferruginibacter sp.]|nr:two-component regulator propeller domain-containing protein [Ferruginibacter sp.]
MRAFLFQIPTHSSQFFAAGDSQPKFKKSKKSLLYFHRMLTGLTKKIVLLLVFWAMFTPFIFCQPYYFTHYQVENGLSNNAVMCSIQDHHGFMWFGTRDGLNRFDGLSFKVFRNSPEDSNSIGSNAITGLFEDDKDHIWVATEKGIYRYDERTEKFTQLKIAGNYSIRELQVIGDDVWYISLYNLFQYNQKTAKVTSYQLDKGVTSYCLMPDKTLWVATDGGTIGRYNTEERSFTEHNLFARSPKTVSLWIESIYNTGTGTLLVGTSNEGLKSFDINTGTYQDLLTFNPDKTEIIVRKIIAVTPEEFWIASQSGIYILNIKTNQSRHLVRDQNNPYSLSDNIVHTLYKDSEGGIWAGTYFGGINYFPKESLTFKKHFPRSGSNSISGYAVREICNDKFGNIWIGTEDAGLNKLIPATNYFINYNTPASKERISYSNIHGLLVKDDQVWVGTYLHGLDVLDAKTGKKLRHYNTTNSSIGSNFIYSLFKKNSGDIMVATDRGLYDYLAEKDDFKLVTRVKKVFFRCLVEDNDGTIWAGTYGDGLFYYNTKTGASGQLLYEAGNSRSLPSNLVNKIYKDEEGNLWFATEGGLCKYVKEKKNFDRYSTANGMPSNVTYAILEDGKKNLWVSTSKGLVCFSPQSKEIKVYTKSNGLLTDQFNYSSGYKDDKGQMYFGSVKGMVTFHPDSIRINTFSPPVFLTGFQVYNKEMLIDAKGSALKNSISFTKDIVLAHSQSSFSIDFAALSYTAPNTTRYAYKMEGLDKDWTYLLTNRKAYFTELNPGSYTFKVSAINSATGQQGKPAILTIRILPPFWKTWWAYTLYAIAFLSITLIVIRHFVNRSREKHQRRLERLEFEKEKENYNDKIGFFINVAHEIRTPLTLIKGPMENIMDRADEIPQIKSSLEIMNKNTDRLLQLSNQLLDFRKVEMNGFRLNLTKENISTILNDHLISFRAFSAQRKIKVTTDYPASFYAYIDAEAFNKIISNLWDNAVKYAGTFVEISFISYTEEDDTYQIIFKNDGHILSPDMSTAIFKSFYRAKETAKLPGTGIGLTLARSLTEIHGGNLVLDTNDPTKNTFILTMPINPTPAE